MFTQSFFLGADSLVTRLTDKINTASSHKLIIAHLPLILVCIEVVSIDVSFASEVLKCTTHSGPGDSRGEVSHASEAKQRLSPRIPYSTFQVVDQTEQGARAQAATTAAAKERSSLDGDSV